MHAVTAAIDERRYLQEYVPLVRRMAHHLLMRLPASVQLDDIMQAGMMGLIDAVDRYDEAHGTQFETYATQRIRGAMLDELRANDWVPRSLRKTQRAIEGAIARAEQRLGRAPSEREIAKEMGVTLTDYQELLAEVKGCQLIYADDFGEGEGESLFERSGADPDSDPLARLKDKRFREELVAAIEKLPEREKTVMGLYYEQELNLREIAAVLGVTESRVCQLHGQAVTRLRTKLKDW
jgi:RNA polymerase sigma factor for flagellar operon FliA